MNEFEKPLEMARMPGENIGKVAVLPTEEEIAFAMEREALKPGQPLHAASPMSNEDMVGKVAVLPTEEEIALARNSGRLTGPDAAK
jgi:acetate kinase